VILSATTVTVAFSPACYVTLSDHVSGFAGVAIHGKEALALLESESI
jgi:hypothetical protein